MIKQLLKSIVCFAIVFVILLQGITPAVASSFSDSFVTAQYYRSPQLAFIGPAVEWILKALATDALERGAVGALERGAVDTLERGTVGALERGTVGALEEAEAASYRAVAGTTELEFALANSMKIDLADLSEAINLGNNIMMGGLAVETIHDVYKIARENLRKNGCKPLIIKHQNSRQVFEVYDSDNCSSIQ
jgi:hypothetical protein